MDWKAGDGKGQKSSNTMMQLRPVGLLRLVFKTIGVLLLNSLQPWRDLDFPFR